MRGGGSRSGGGGGGKEREEEREGGRDMEGERIERERVECAAGVFYEYKSTCFTSTKVLASSTKVLEMTGVLEAFAAAAHRRVRSLERQLQESEQDWKLGTQFACFTSTKVQILTPEDLWCLDSGQDEGRWLTERRRLVARAEDAEQRNTVLASNISALIEPE